jgi:hypothetical protein
MVSRDRGQTFTAAGEAAKRDSIHSRSSNKKRNAGKGKDRGADDDEKDQGALMVESIKPQIILD